MSERITIYCTGAVDQTYTIDRLELAELGSEPNKRTITTWKERAASHEFHFGSRDSLFVLVLAFVRAALYRYVRVADDEEDQVPIFRKEISPEVFLRFKNLHEGANKSSDHGYKWVQQMLSLPDDLPELQPCGRLKQWFSVSQRKSGHIVECDLGALHPESICVVVNSQLASEVQLDCLESYLSNATDAGLPCHWEIQGLNVGGKAPSVRPEWFGQEAEYAEMKRIYESANTSVLCIVGPTWTGKTVLASHGLRRLIGNHQLKHSSIFRWSFPRQHAASHIPMPSLDFFQHLAEFLNIEQISKESSVASATVLRALKKTPTLLFLDGIEATFAGQLAKTPSRFRTEYDSALADLFKGLSAQRESFLLATSQLDFANTFGLATDAVHVLRLRKPYEPVFEKFTQEYRGDSQLNIGIDDDSDLLPTAQALRLGWEHPEDKTWRNWFRRKGPIAEPAKDYAPVNQPPQLSKSQKQMVDLTLGLLSGTPSSTLFCILCVSINGVSEDDLLEVADSLPLDVLGLGRERRKKFSPEEWDHALNALIHLQSPILHQFRRNSWYSVHPGAAWRVCDGMKTESPALWGAINSAYGDMLLKRAPKEVSKNEEILPLVHAAIYFCQAGKKDVAYHQIGREKLSRGLKGHIIFYLGDYQSPKTVNAAVLGKSDTANITPIPPETVALCIHTYALCSKYDGDKLEQALEEEEDAWRRAQAVGTASAVLPIACGLLRLYHIFGRLHECKAIESIMVRRLIIQGLKGRAGRKGLEDRDIVDGASAIASFLAMSWLYRGKGPRWMETAFDAATKQCRSFAQDVPFLLPTFGRPWHALVLLEMGKWEICEKAYNARDEGQWCPGIERFKQVAAFELLAAKTFLLKAETLTGDRRRVALDMAGGFAEEALRRNTEGKYRWWRTFSALTLAQISACDRQDVFAADSITLALSLAEQHSFGLLQVDALLERAKLARATGRKTDCTDDARQALALAQQVGYGLRVPTLEELFRVRR